MLAEATISFGRSSYLLEFQRSTEEWDSAWLQADGGVRCEGISIIEIHRQFLIFGGTHQDSWEGAGHEEFGGGILLYCSENPCPNIGWSVINESAVGIGHLVTNMQGTADEELLIETFAPRLSPITVASEPTASIVSTGSLLFRIRWVPFRRSTACESNSAIPRGPVALPDSLHCLNAQASWFARAIEHYFCDLSIGRSTGIGALGAPPERYRLRHL